jgi:hypothetical protein
MYAEGLYIQLKAFKNLPLPICEILGLPIQKTSVEIVKDDMD